MVAVKSFLFSVCLTIPLILQDYPIILSITGISLKSMVTFILELCSDMFK